MRYRVGFRRFWVNFGGFGLILEVLGDFRRFRVDLFRVLE